MTRPTQGLLLAFLGAVLVRLSLSDAYLRYVTDWMKWPILVSGALLLLLAVPLILGQQTEPDSHGHGVPSVTWLLVLPGLIVFVISPPQLGSFLAERRAGEMVAAPEPAVLSDLDSDGGSTELEITEFVYRAQAGGESLEGRDLDLTGFVSYGQGDDTWFVTRMTIGCCAADAVAYQVQVDGAPRPPRDQWVTVSGTYAEGTGIDGRHPPTIDAAEVTETEAPRQTYE